MSRATPEAIRAVEERVKNLCIKGSNEWVSMEIVGGNVCNPTMAPGGVLYGGAMAFDRKRPEGRQERWCSGNRQQVQAATTARRPSSSDDHWFVYSSYEL
jgi:hypothetical protein